MPDSRTGTLERPGHRSATNSPGCARRRSTSCARCSLSIAAGRIGSPRRSPNAGLMTKSSRDPRTCVRERESPHHKVGTESTFRSSPKKCLQRAGRYAFKAGVSASTDPSGFASATLPFAAAETRPATPSEESSRRSNGSHHASPTRRSSTSTRRRPDSVFRYTMSPRTVRSRPSTSS